MMDEFSQRIILTVIDKFVIGLSILLAGYFIAKAIEAFKGEQALRKEVEVLRDKTALQHLQRQIEELYSPLWGLIQYGNVVNQVEFQKTPQCKTKEEVEEMRRYLVEKYYLPLNAQVSSLIRDKIYLLDSDVVPGSFHHFLMHAAQFEILHNLWSDKKIRSDDIPGIEYPESFREDVRISLERLRDNYNGYISRLGVAT